MPITPSTYLLASSVVGAAQVLDAFALLRWKGRIAGAITTAFSFAEYLWAGASFFVWRSAESPFPYWLPVSFIAYVAALAAAGIFLAVQHRGERELRLPSHLVVAGGIFGVYFSIASLAHVAGA